MKNRFETFWIICFLLIALTSNHCSDLEHKHPLDPENPNGGVVRITIDDPVQGQEVIIRYIVKGTVTPRADVSVWVHPLATNLHWVQNFPIVDNEGNWQCICIFGTEDQVTTEEFEVYAITPRKEFVPFEVSASVPENTNISNVVFVIRPP